MNNDGLIDRWVDALLVYFCGINTEIVINYILGFCTLLIVQT